MEKVFYPDPDELNEARKLLWQSYFAFIKDRRPTKDSPPSHVKEFSEASNAFLDAIARV